MRAPEQASAHARNSRARRFLLRVAGFLAVAWCVGAIANGVSARESRRIEPAGFGAGLLHGAVMPCALPALVAGRDPILYAERNTGRGYKLGYTTGVNLCGAVFFGLLFRRLTRRFQASAQYQADR